MAESAFAKVAAQFKALPRPQQLGILFGLPAIPFAVLVYLLWGDLGRLGPDQKLPGFLRRSTSEGLWTRIADTHSQTEAKAKIAARRDQVQKQIDDLKDEINAIEKRLPKDADKAIMRQQIQEMARGVTSDIGSVVVKSVRIQEDSRSTGPASAGVKDLRSVTFRTELFGDMNGIIKFIDLVEKYQDRFMKVNSVSVKAGEVKAEVAAAAASGQPPQVVRTFHAATIEVVTHVYTKQGAK